MGKSKSDLALGTTPATDRSTVTTGDQRAEIAGLRYVAFMVVASTIDGSPLFSVADIIEPLPGNNYNLRKLLRSARLTAGERGYVMVGRAGLEWNDYDASARRVEGLSFVPHPRNWRRAA